MQVESDIAPYKGLFMGLFFMTVGMEISAKLFLAKFKTILAGIIGLIVGKVRQGLLHSAVLKQSAYVWHVWSIVAAWSL